MLDFALEYRAGVDAITDQNKLGLSQYALDEEEWELLRQLRDVLQVCACRTASYIITSPPAQILKDATSYFSRSTPNLAMVIPAMDFIDETFATGMLKQKKLSPAIRAAISMAKQTLNQYYSLTDFSDLYRITMGPYIKNRHCIDVSLICDSPPPTPQTSILQIGRLVIRMDRDRKGTCHQCLQQFVRYLCCCRNSGE
jgi:hypothetical protein